MEFTIKEANIEHLEEIQKLNLLLFQKEHREFDATFDCNWTFSKKGEIYFRNHITKNDQSLLVAQVNSDVIGYLAGGIAEKSEYRILPTYAELENMFIMDEHRDKGVGSALVQAFLAWCKSKKVGRVKVIASAGNVDAINFYRKNGFADYDVTLETVL